MRRPHAPQATRRVILESAWRLVRRRGFQATGLNDILADTGLTKGAFYHHFPTKLALGYALVEGPLRDYVETWWVKPLEGSDDPVAGLARIVQERAAEDIPAMLPLGCPLTNLMAEMALVDEGFRDRLDELYRLWRKSLSRALRHGQQRGTLRGDLDAEPTAAAIIAILQGAFVQAKTTQSMDTFRDCMSGLADYLTQIRR
ncbi:MAG: TetR/AcrR family transcriptional regulator [Magnetospirillum sp. WYHS-4]